MTDLYIVGLSGGEQDRARREAEREAERRRLAVFEMVAGLVDVSPGDAAHGHGRGDDHVRQFGEQVIAAAADPLARVQAVHADERLRGLARLFGQLEQAYLDGDVPMAGVQVTGPTWLSR